MSIVDIEYGLCLLLQWIYESKSASLLFNLCYGFIYFARQGYAVLHAFHPRCTTAKTYEVVVHFRTVLLIKYSAPHHHDNSWAIAIMCMHTRVHMPFLRTKYSHEDGSSLGQNNRPFSCSLGVDAHVGHTLSPEGTQYFWWPCPLDDGRVNGGWLNYRTHLKVWPNHNILQYISVLLFWFGKAEVRTNVSGQR